MIFRKFAQGTALFLVIGSLASTTASSMRDWEDTIDEGGPEDGMPRGLVDERSLAPEETESTDIVEVAIAPPKRQNFAARPHKGLALVPLQSKRVGGITDETATTGENAKKRLPSSVMQDQSAELPFLHDINQVTTSFMPLGSLEKAD